MKRALKQKWFLGFFAVAIVAVLMTVPSYGIDNQNDPVLKRASLQAEIENMREIIKAEGHEFTVGVNPAMQYTIEQLCGLNTGLTLPNMYLTEALDNLSNLARPDALPAAYTGYASSVKNQGSCGSCWAFAA
ncbi:MAG: C1 family peptidase, partial [Candidatus Aminicenantes bacterium]|nr:C1 family peptidase [Candidatus Aminicenantes bacterium]